MKITTTQADGTAIVGIAGDLRIATVGDAKVALVAALADCDEIQIDLSEVDKCDTAGVQLLLMAAASARAKGKKFTAIGQTASFRVALDRVGVAHECFESPAAAPDDNRDKHDRG